MTAATRQVDDVVARLETIPARIGRAVEGWNEVRLRAHLVAEEWSAAEILAHLRASDDILTYRFYAVLVRENPPLPAYDERRWAEVVGYDRMRFHDSLDVYARRRAELVALLRRAAPGDWERSGEHEALGTISLLAMLRGLVEHEEEHCAQLERLASRSTNPQQ